MCAPVNVVPAGKPWKLPTKFAVAAVMLFDESRVTTNAIVIFPEPPDSAFVIGGTSLAGRRSAVNVGLVGVVVDGAVDDLEQPAARASTAARTAKRFIPISFCRSEKLSCEVESQVERRRRSAARHLREGRRERVGERQGEEMPADPLLDAEPVLRVARLEAADARRDLGHQIRAGQEPKA